ncbi:MAG: Rrf2 family transcriptional regulator [Planctomycetota bacterium]
MFSRTTEYALRAAVALAQQPETRLASRDIAARTQVPLGYLSRVMQTLVEAHVVDSQRGPSGGFKLVNPPGETSLLQVVQAIDPIKRITECPLKLSEHCDTLCPLHRRMDRLAALAIQELGDATLDTLTREPVVPLGLQVSSANQSGA